MGKYRKGLVQQRFRLDGDLLFYLKNVASNNDSSLNEEVERRLRDSIENDGWREERAVLLNILDRLAKHGR